MGGTEVTVTVKITEVNIGYKEFDSYEEALQWTKEPENDYDGITWGDGWIEEVVIENDW